MSDHIPFPSFDSGGASSQRPAAREPINRERDTDQLKADNERLLLITEALWDIIREKLDLPEDELARAIHRLDLQDGFLDFRKRPSPPRNCPKCSRVLTKKKATCTFCGTPVPIVPFER
jgi:hypothetical protein